MDQDLNPKWLLKIKKTGKIPDRIPFEKVLQRALFYPACGIDFMYVNLLTEQLHNINRNTKFNLKESLRNFFSKKGNQYPVISKYIYTALNSFYWNLLTETVDSIVKDIFYIDTYIFTDYMGSVKYKSFNFSHENPNKFLIYQDFIFILLTELSSKYKLICEKYIKTYKINKKNSSDTAIFINQAENIEELIYCYKNDKKRYKEIFAKFKKEKLNGKEILWIFNEEEPFVHWSVWEDSSSGKLFNVIYFVEEAHVNFLRTFIKYNCCPKILVLHNYGRMGFEWTLLHYEEKNFLKMMNIAGLPKYLIFETEYVNNPHFNEYTYRNRNEKNFYGNYIKVTNFFKDYFLIKKEILKEILLNKISKLEYLRSSWLL